ncbi:MAG TPA: lysophospholipid acyltransferase family protein [Candidatus Limnocylindria bacterium]
MRLEGAEHVPEAGPYILVANHINWKDPPAIELLLRVAIRFMAKSESFETPFIGGLLRGIGCFPVRRGQADRRALELCLSVLRAGRPLGYFPEGTRSRDGRLRRAHPGIAFLALRSGAPIVPVGVTGTPAARIRRSDILVRVGEPFRANDLPESATHDDQAVADAIMRRIAALLPEAMRGSYADGRQ